ncbi:MAG: hypothetical protein ACREQX_01975 [Candidatus Binataceae bacterium]
MNIRTVLAISAFACIPMLFAHNSYAQVDPWEFEVYPYATEPRGMVELETDNAIVANGHSHAGQGTSSGEFRSQGLWYNQYEFTYGLTDRIEAAGYLKFAEVPGHGYWYAGSSYRLRGQLFTPGRLPVDLGWYVELEWNRTPQFDDDDLEVELRPIIEKDIGPFSLIFDPVFEKPLVGESDNKWFEFGYASGMYYRWSRYFSPGVEFYGGIGHLNDNDQIGQQQHYVFPVVWGELSHGIEYNAGPGIGLTSGSDRVVLKFNIELERYIGALLGPSADTGWFF